MGGSGGGGGGGGPPPATFAEYLKMLCGGLGSDTPKLRGATLLALSKVLHAFPTHPVITSALPSLLSTLLPLFKEKSREVVTSLVSFVKASVGFLPPHILTPLLPALLRAMLVWSGVRKERIKAKVRAVLSRCVRRCGLAAVSPLIPKEDAPLLKYLMKEAGRRERKKAEVAQALAEQEEWYAAQAQAAQEGVGGGGRSHHQHGCPPRPCRGTGGGGG
jgi:hypothetical protein